jgi:hypothetical protein
MAGSLRFAVSGGMQPEMCEATGEPMSEASILPSALGFDFSAWSRCGHKTRVLSGSPRREDLC